MKVDIERLRERLKFIANYNNMICWEHFTTYDIAQDGIALCDEVERLRADKKTLLEDIDFLHKKLDINK